MANPLIHSKSSVKRWGGKVEDYLPIHELIDSPKATMNNNSARLMTHNTWFAYHIVPKVFGYNITNSDGKSVDVVDIAMLHIAEDFRMKFVPTPTEVRGTGAPLFVHFALRTRSGVYHKLKNPIMMHDGIAYPVSFCLGFIWGSQSAQYKEYPSSRI